MLENLKRKVLLANLELPKNNLVTWTSGNVSGRDNKTGLIVIKPSGVRYEDLKLKDMVVVDINGKVLEGRKPSVDTLTHLYVYKHRNDVGSVLHTHSNYATAFAANGMPIEVYLTAIGDEFGCSIPVSDYAKIGGTEIGKEIIKHIGDSSAILIKNHGVFTIGKNPESAVKTAVMVEDVAKTCFLALLLGKANGKRLNPIPDKEVKRLHKRYKEKYGQKDSDKR